MFNLIHRLRPIIKTVLFCGRHELPFRGHRDYGSLEIQDVDECHNEGVFRAALKFRIDAGDQVLKSHLESAPNNATYISWQTQNDIINACRVAVTREIVAEVQQAKYFAILVDDTTDIALHEQCSISLRYLKNSVIMERFLAFVDVSRDMTAAGLARSVLETLHTVGLDPSFLRGQGYDGAATMSGVRHGLQAEIKKVSPRAPFVHCANHVLNLAIQSASAITPIRNAHGQIREIANFFHSAKRSSILQSQCAQSGLQKPKKLKAPCPTRWVEYHDSVIRFMELLQQVVCSLEELATTGLFL